MATVATNKLWAYIESLSLSNRDRSWLAGKLLEPTHKADPTELTREEFFDSLDRGEEEYRQGRTHRINSVEELNSFLNSL